MTERKLSESHKKKLAAGRAKAAKLKTKENEHKTKVWLRWCKEEAGAYAELVNARRGFGDETKAYQRWRAIVAVQPEIPATWVDN